MLPAFGFHFREIKPELPLVTKEFSFDLISYFFVRLVSNSLWFGISGRFVKNSMHGIEGKEKKKLYEFSVKIIHLESAVGKYFLKL